MKNEIFCLDYEMIATPNQQHNFENPLNVESLLHVQTDFTSEKKQRNFDSVSLGYHHPSINHMYNE